MRLQYLLIYLFLNFSIHLYSNDIHYSYCNNFEQEKQILDGKELNIIKDPVRAYVLSFDGKTTFYNLSNLRATDEISFSAWVNPKNLEEHSSTVFGQKDAFHLRLMDVRTLRFTVYNRYVAESIPVISEDCWQHIGFSCTRDGHLKLYHNGMMIEEDTVARNFFRKRDGFLIALDHTKSIFEGMMDNLRFESRILSDEEFQQEYKSTKIAQNLKNGLVLWNQLNGNRIEADNMSKVLAVNSVKFVKDSKFGKVARFYNREGEVVHQAVKYDRHVTVSFWIKPKLGNKGNYNSIGGNNAFIVRLDGKNNIDVTVPFRGHSSAKFDNLYDGNWHHIVISIMFGVKAQYYVDGNLIREISHTSSSNSNKDFSIGKTFYNDYYLGDMANFAIWNRLLSKEEVNNLYHKRVINFTKVEKANFTFLIIVLFGVLLILLVVIYLLVLKNRSYKEKKEFVASSSINFLGVFRAFDKGGNELSNEFTPRLIQLTYMILIWPYVKKRNIKSSEISDVLWPDEDVTRQKNNRNSNINRLRSVLKKFDGVELKFENAVWKLEYSDNLDIDLIQILEEKKFQFDGNSNKICKTLQIAELENLLFDFNNLFIDKLYLISENLKKESHFTQLIFLADLISNLEFLSENALELKIYSLKKLKRTEDAKKEFEKYKERYRAYFKEDYVNGNLI
jgi:hypothetical protein